MRDRDDALSTSSDGLGIERMITRSKVTNVSRCYPHRIQSVGMGGELGCLCSQQVGLVHLSQPHPHPVEVTGAKKAANIGTHAELESSSGGKRHQGRVSWNKLDRVK